MQIGLIGLGKMGMPLAHNLHRKHEVIAYDVNNDLVSMVERDGIAVARSLKELVDKLRGRRVIWLMVPSGSIVEGILQQLMPMLQPKDIIIDGGNSYFKDSMNRAAAVSDYHLDYLDCGTSGGVEGALHGVCVMVGGKKEAFSYCEPIFESIALPGGYLYAGKSGSGHYVKMVHNGIEYGMMQAIAEGFSLMHQSEFDLDFKAVADLWNHGSVVRSWLMELCARAFEKDANLKSIKGIAHASGEGQWMIETALEKKVAVPVIALSLLMRYQSQDEENFSAKVIAALRNEFGGHAVEKS